MQSPIRAEQEVWRRSHTHFFFSHCVDCFFLFCCAAKADDTLFHFFSVGSFLKNKNNKISTKRTSQPLKSKLYSTIYITNEWAFVIIKKNKQIAWFYLYKYRQLSLEMMLFFFLFFSFMNKMVWILYHQTSCEGRYTPVHTRVHATPTEISCCAPEEKLFLNVSMSKRTCALGFIVWSYIVCVCVCVYDNSLLHKV